MCQCYGETNGFRFVNPRNPDVPVSARIPSEIEAIYSVAGVPYGVSRSALIRQALAHVARDKELLDLLARAEVAGQLNRHATPKSHIHAQPGG